MLAGRFAGHGRLLGYVSGASLVALAVSSLEGGRERSSGSRHLSREAHYGLGQAWI